MTFVYLEIKDFCSIISVPYKFQETGPLAMGWRFHKSFTVIPGLRLNLSKSGLSASIGGAPFTLNVGPRGLMGTASIPGTGISYRQHFGTGSPRSNGGTTPSDYSPSPVPLPVPSYPSFHQLPLNTAPVEVIHSASTESMTSASLKEVKQLIETAYKQHEEISVELNTARVAKIKAERRYGSWERGFLFKRIFKKAFAKRKEVLEEESAKVSELEEQQELSRISTQIDIESEQAELFFRLRDEFAALAECKAIWDIKTRQATDKVRERTTAIMKLSRERVRFELGLCDLIQWEQKVPHFNNAKGGEIYLFPGFILYRAAREAFSLIEYQDMIGTATNVPFQEEEGVPADSVVIGKTWARANKDGSRDRRFAQNYEIPIAQYGAVALKSHSGLWEEFQFSNPQKLLNFITALNAFTRSFARVANV